MTTMGERIQRRRMEKGLERSDLARLVGVTPQLVGQWESGIVKNIRLPNLVRLLDALDLSLRYLVQGADRSSPPIKLLPAPPTPLQTATNVLQQAFGSGLIDQECLGLSIAAVDRVIAAKRRRVGQDLRIRALVRAYDLFMADKTTADQAVASILDELLRDSNVKKGEHG